MRCVARLPAGEGFWSAARTPLSFLLLSRRRKESGVRAALQNLPRRNDASKESECFMKRLLALGLMIGLLAVGTVLAAPKATDLEKKKEALRELQEFIGGWKGAGSVRQPPGKRDPLWDETVQWNWRFKDNDCWLSVDFKGGKF